MDRAPPRRAFDEPSFLRALTKLAAGADWIVIPDIVCRGRDSLRFSLSWLPRLLHFRRPLLLAVQNGIEAHHVRHLLGPHVGIFVGGDTLWKESTLPIWGDLAADTNCYLHVGRVNTARRIRLCAEIGAHSFDGSSASRFSTTLPALDAARRQLHLPFI